MKVSNVACAYQPVHSLKVKVSFLSLLRGVGKQGQLGHNDLTSSPVPTHLSSLSDANYTIAAVSCGIAHTFFLTDKGNLLACGQNTFGALGVDSGAENVVVPTDVAVPYQEEAVAGRGEGASRIVHVSCGGAHTAVVDSRGRLYTTGSNTCGQLGLGTFDDAQCTFTRVTEFVGESDVRQRVMRDTQTMGEVYGSQEMPVCAYVSCGEEFTAMITREHGVYTVGLGLGE